MVCEKCKEGKMVLHAFSNGDCEKCACNIVTSHIPCDRLCDKCSEQYNSCKECGSEIK